MKKHFRARNAQHLIEFALALPVIMITLMIIIEFGYAVLARITLSEAVKISLNRVNRLYNEPGDASVKTIRVQNSIRQSIVDYLQAHNVAYSNSVSVTISQTGGQAVVNVGYSYAPAFILPNIMGGSVIPSVITVNSTQVINSTLLQPNQYNSYLNTASLSNMTNYGLIDGSGVKNTFLKSPMISSYYPYKSYDAGNQSIAFLIEFGPGSGTYARLFNWWGEDVLPQNLMVNTLTGYLAVKRPESGGNWTDTTVPYVWILAALGYSEAIYVDMTLPPTPSNNKLDLLSNSLSLNLGLPWCSQTSCSTCGSCNGNNTSSLIDNLSKRALCHRTSTGTDASGTFDPIYVPGYYGSLKSHFYTRNNYALRLIVPTSTPQPNSSASSGSYNFTNFENDPNIVNYYIDNDGDGIPNYWDTYPEYPDANADGILDGRQGTIVNFANVTSPVAYTGEAYSSAILSIPIQFNGNITDNRKTNSSLIALTPQRYIYYGVLSNTTNAYYFWNGTALVRRMPTWDSNGTTAKIQQSRFFNGNLNGTASLGKSPELDFLTNSTSGLEGTFSAARKVTTY